MLFVGFGFIMTFLKRYGLEEVSLNLLCVVIALEWATLVIGFFQMQYDQRPTLGNDTEVVDESGSGSVIVMDVVNRYF